MADYEYRVVPFLGDIPQRDKQGAEKVAKQLQATIDANVGGGWEFYRIDQVQILARPGCLAAFGGAREATFALDMVSFRRLKG